jgi:hypothetical protein
MDDAKNSEKAVVIRSASEVGENTAKSGNKPGNLK